MCHLRWTFRPESAVILVVVACLACEKPAALMSIHELTRDGKVRALARRLTKDASGVNEPDHSGHSPLWWAARGSIGCSSVLLAFGADPNIGDYSTGYTPLYMATIEGHVDIIYVLLEHGADPNLKDVRGLAPLHRAAMMGRLEIVRALLRYDVDPNVATWEGRTPLHFASAEEMIRVLTDGGAKPGMVDYRLATSGGFLRSKPPEVRQQYEKALLTAWGGNLATLRGELARTPELVHKRLGGETLLHRAVIHDHREIVRHLVEPGADIDARHICGSTPLLFAVAGKKTEIVNYLLEHGADPGAQNERGHTPLQLAVKRDEPSIVKALLSRGARVNVADKDGLTPLHLARSVECMKLLLSHGADPNARDSWGRTPLHRTSTAELAKVLLDAGADVNSHDSLGVTPLRLASFGTVTKEGREYIRFLHKRSAEY